MATTKDHPHPGSTAVDPTPPTAKRGGRTLDTSRDQVIRDAALDLLMEVGYDGFTMDMVATRARAGKGALYRRWESKAALVVDAVACHKAMSELEPGGSLDEDLAAYLDTFPEGEEADDQGALLTQLVVASQRDPEFRVLCRRQFIEPHAEMLQGIIRRAQARGEARADLDVELVAEMVMSVLIHRRLATDLAIDRPFGERVVNHLLRPLLSPERP